MASKKQKKTTKVQLSATSVHRFETALRDGLVASGSVMMSENKHPKLQSKAKIELDPATTARLSEALRKGMVASHAVMADEVAKLDQLTGQIKARRPRPRAKKSKK